MSNAKNYSLWEEYVRVWRDVVEEGYEYEGKPYLISSVEVYTQLCVPSFIGEKRREEKTKVGKLFYPRPLADWNWSR